MTDDTQGLEGKLLENGRFRFDKTFNFDATTEEVSDFIVSIIIVYISNSILGKTDVCPMLFI